MSCLLSRGYVSAWISSLTPLWGIGLLSSASSCCCTFWRKTFQLWAGSSLSTVLKHYLWRLNYTWTATRSSPSLLVCSYYAPIQCFYSRYTCSASFSTEYLVQHEHNSVILSSLFRTAITAVRTNVANLSDAAMWKIRRARFARNRQKSVRSLRDSVKGGPAESKRAFSLPESLSNRIREWHRTVYQVECETFHFHPVCGQTVFASTLSASSVLCWTWNYPSFYTWNQILFYLQILFDQTGPIPDVSLLTSLFAMFITHQYLKNTGFNKWGASNQVIGFILGSGHSPLESLGRSYRIFFFV